ncbi:hypothetical protein COT49_02315 [candidate division WWE3 bacterium CG08_land_8_20_14_0_20_40_13]|uniref:Uncharacterized protein n=1 Tax=candidate division WWE3 bacterium CG08_land_8_20_14_0_20_40_13 TaxID=1975084 RepID=A0A2H0XDK4_UNCKA|nr:MAG: hypothetical protein COT49_02315 [candidate division WWE3 bacterium CG08_land_8_20_14_0_20_40_13]
MPRFILTVLFILILFGALLLYVFFTIDPSSPIIVGGFLALLWIFFGGIFSLPLSYLEGKPKEIKVKSGILKPWVLRDIFRKSLRRGLILSLALVSFLILRYLHAFSPLNFMLVVTVLLIGELFWSFHDVN